MFTTIFEFLSNYKHLYYFIYVNYKIRNTIIICYFIARLKLRKILILNYKFSGEYFCYGSLSLYFLL